MVSRSGDILATYTDPRFEVHSPPTADAAGNVYVLTQSGIHSIDNGGNPRWHAYAFRARPNDPELVTLPPPLLGPDGGVYAAGLYPELIAVDSANGNERFRVADGGSPIAGAASLLFVSGSPSTRVIDLTTHAFAGQLDPGSGQATVLGSPFGSTGLAWGVLGFEYGVIAVTSNGYVVFGTCGKSPWTFRDGWPEFASLIGADERLITVTWDENVNTSVMRSLTDTWGAYGSDGTRKAGPAKTADLPILGLQGKETPMFAGADGTSYAVLCDGNPLGQMKSWVVAYGMDFAEQWRIEVSPACPAGNGVMTDDGVIYLTRSSNVNVELVAVQTTSPGLAKSSWPTLRHDNQGTSWLTP